MFTPAHNIWTCGVCETCVKNSHETVKMVRQMLDGEVEAMVCPVCGATKMI